MRPKIVLIGTGYFPLSIYKTIVTEGNADVVAFSVERVFIKETEIEGLPVIPFEDLDRVFNMEDYQILITIGYSKMNSLREQYYNECKRRGFRIYTFISKYAMVYSEDIGEGSILYPGCYIGPYAKIGKCSVITINVYVSHHNEIGEYCFISGGVMFGGVVKMGSHCFIGMNCVIKNEITIGSKVFIGANSYANSDMESNKGYIGNPAKNPKGISSELMVRFV